jgi:hypothetical protein
MGHDTQPTVLRRTFEAAKFPKGSTERARLNRDTLTSEYMTSYRYDCQELALMNDGTPNPVQTYHHWTTRTKTEAEAKAEQIRARNAKAGA